MLGPRTILVLLALAGLGAWWVNDAAVERTETRIRGEYANAAVIALQDARKEDQRIIFDNARTDDAIFALVQKNRIAAARAAAAAGGLRDALDDLRERVKDGSAAAGRCEATVDGLGQLLRQCGERYRLVDEAGADARARGLKCERYYDALTPGQP